MTKLTKLSLIALLAGTLAVVGCGDSSDNGDTGGSGGSAGAGGTGGTGGTGGVGGVACETDCGVGNEFPSGSPIGSGDLDCTVMGIPIPLTLDITAVSSDFSTFSIGVQNVIPTNVVDLILALADSADIDDLQGVVGVTTGEPSTVDVGLSPVPCTVCFFAGTVATTVFDPAEETIAVEGTEVTFSLDEITLTLNAAGLPLVLSNVGEDPACTFDQIPSVTLEGGAGGAGGMGGMGGGAPAL